MPQTLDDNIYDPVDAKLVAKMHKAITVIQLKLEGQLIRRHPEWKLSHRDLFSMVDFANGTITIDGQTHKLLDGNFPTVDPADPLALTEGENELMTILANSFMHSDRLNTHMRFLYSKGSMYKTINGNLLFHGCIPLDENGKLLSLSIAGEQYSGKAMLFMARTKWRFLSDIFLKIKSFTRKIIMPIITSQRSLRYAERYLKCLGLTHSVVIS